MWRVSRSALALVAAALGGASACNPEELTGGPLVVCEEIGRTIANVSWSCGVSLEVANDRGRGFIDSHQCKLPATLLGEQQIEVGLACPVAMAQLPCDLATQAGDDYAAWLRAVPACADVVAEGGGS